MPWVRFDDQFTTHRKVNGLTDTEFRLHVEAVFWCARNLTDGRVGQDELELVSRIRSPRKHVARLVDRGLWLPTADGWRIHDYLEYQPSRERVEADRKANATRQQKWRDQHKQDRNVVTNAERNGVSNDTPARPDPKGRGGTGRSHRGTSVTRASPEPPPPKCEDHLDTPDPPPCGACGDARKARERWDREQLRAEQQRRSAEARARAAAAADAIAACQLCDTTGYHNGRLCTHDPDQPNRARTGAATARAALRSGLT